jgi:hypothetical protein
LALEAAAVKSSDLTWIPLRLTFILDFLAMVAELEYKTRTWDFKFLRR